jgi:hypothetical protein
MASSRRYIRDARGRFSGGGNGGVVSGPRRPRRQKPLGQMTRTLKASLEGLKQSDRQRDLMFTGKAAGPILSRGRRAAPGIQAKVAEAAGPSGRVSQALGSSLRKLAQSDARFYRDLAKELGPAPKQMKGGKAKPKPKRLPGS